MKIKDTKKLPFLISFCMAVGGLLMVLFMCGYVEFGIYSTVGKLAVYIAFALQALNILTGVPVLSLGIPALLSCYFDIFSGFVQALVFTLLSMVYIAGALPEPQDAAA